MITRESLVSLTAQIDLGGGIVDQTVESVVELLLPTIETIVRTLSCLAQCDNEGYSHALIILAGQRRKQLHLP